MARLLNNKLKIISGKYKSRIITIPNKSNLKPTKAFIRESLFNIVNLKICDTSLDLFSGSGILSLEALSRGIKKATLVEQDIEIPEGAIVIVNHASTVTGAPFFAQDLANYLVDSGYDDVVFLDAHPSKCFTLNKKVKHIYYFNNVNIL